MAVEAEVTRTGVLDMQVCVPEDWTDEQVKEFADSRNLAGTSYGWQIRKKGSKYLRGEPERRACSDRNGCVHIMLDC